MRKGRRARTNLSWAAASNEQENRGEWVMDAKYNYIIDSMTWRIALNLAGFAAWLAAAVALLRAAA